MSFFDDLRTKFPNMPKPELFESMGGHWPDLIDDPAYVNTCCIRLSLAINAAGRPITKYKEAITGAGDPIIIKVATMGKYLREVWRASDWGVSKQPGQDFGPADMPNRSGIVVYHVAWVNATGHFDLWTGSAFVGAGNFADVKLAKDIAMWFED